MTMVMKDKSISASSFKARCLALLDEVAANGSSFVITKRGKPVARVTPIEPPESLRGSVTYLVSDDELIAPASEPWHAETK
jgi:prevent-host-death family protein